LRQTELERLVFLDESGAKTNMTRAYARAKRGSRSVDYVPHGHWNTTTMVAAITWNSPIAPMVLDGPMDGDAFEAYLEQVLLPALPENAIVVMDNLGSHKTPAVEQLITQANASLMYLPPYSPDYNPIEQMWSKVKSHLKTVKARTKEDLWQAVAEALETITPDDARGFFFDSVVGIKS
jgi:transposase